MKRIKDSIKTYCNYFKNLTNGQKFIHIFIYGVLIVFLTSYFKQTLIILSLGIILLFIFSFYQNTRFIKHSNGNGIIFGGRGKGKGLLLNKKINSDKRPKHYCNIYYNNKTEILNIKEYIDSILPNTTHHFINDNIQIIKKKDKFEKVNVYWDDVGVYAPNYMDNELKKYYPSLSALLPINRHLYDAYMTITVQDMQRPYKLLRELQTDFSIKALKSFGWGYFWNAIPLLSLFNVVKYRYYENTESAVNGLLPFNSKSLINETLKHGYLTSGQATKEQYIATHGKIFNGYIIQFKKNILYDTREFHKVVFGNKAP